MPSGASRNRRPPPLKSDRAVIFDTGSTVHSLALHMPDHVTNLRVHTWTRHRPAPADCRRGAHLPHGRLSGRSPGGDHRHASRSGHQRPACPHALPRRHIVEGAPAGQGRGDHHRLRYRQEPAGAARCRGQRDRPGEAARRCRWPASSRTEQHLSGRCRQPWPQDARGLVESDHVADQRSGSQDPHSPGTIRAARVAAAIRRWDSGTRSATPLLSLLARLVIGRCRRGRPLFASSRLLLPARGGVDSRSQHDGDQSQRPGRPSGGGIAESVGAKLPVAVCAGRIRPLTALPREADRAHDLVDAHRGRRRWIDLPAPWPPGWCRHQSGGRPLCTPGQDTSAASCSSSQG